MLTRKINEVFFTSRKKRRGIAAVEFALAAPILALLTIGMMEMSRGLSVKVMLSNAARKACRTAIQRDKQNSDAIAEVKDIINTDYNYSVTQFNPNTVGNITITVTNPNGVTLSDSLDAPSGSTVSVQVGIPVKSTMWVSSFFISATDLESETVIMMKQ